MKRRSFVTALIAAPFVITRPALAQVPAVAIAFPLQTPIHVTKSGLRARDAEALSLWYQTHVGLQELSREGATIHLGAGGITLLEITEVEGIVLAPMRVAGLYHNAYLLPSRHDLARWVLNASNLGMRIDGAADHLVSEAIYLTDPEGNGVEIYADRPADEWEWNNGQVEMASLQIDFQGMVAELQGQETRWFGAPPGTCLGHVHMKVGDTARASAFWRETMGFDAVRERMGASFLSTGGYHHTIAVNEWNSFGAGPRDPIHVGLDFVELGGSAVTAAASYQDDWGNSIRMAV